MFAGHTRRIDDTLAIAGHLAPTDPPIVGTPDDDQLSGTDQADVFDLSQGGHDSIEALDGDDVVQLGGAFDPLDGIDGGAGFDAVALGGEYDLTISGTMLKNVEELRLAGGDYKLILAADLLAAGAALAIVAGQDIPTGTVRVDGAATAGDLDFTAGAGDDSLFAGSGDDVFHASASGRDKVAGGGGFDLLDLSGLSSGVILDLGRSGTQQIGDATLSLRGLEAVWGTHATDLIAGTRQSDWIVGFGGDDQLYGRNGNDLIEVGVFNGIVTGNGLIDGGQGGLDIVSFAALGGATGAVRAQLGVAGLQDTGQGTFRITDVEGLSGTAFDDALIGSNNLNYLFGGAGSDTLIGKGGSDFLWGDAVYGVDGSGPPKVIDDPEAGGVDTLDGGDGNDVLDGGGGDDNLLGGADADDLSGGTGNDLLTGGSAADVLAGGSGTDRFIFDTVSDSAAAAADTIKDFTTGDLIDVRKIDADVLTSGDQAFHFGATKDHVGDIVVSYDFRHNLTVVDLFVNGDKTPDMTINLTGNVALSAADFIL